MTPRHDMDHSSFVSREEAVPTPDATAPPVVSPALTAVVDELDDIIVDLGIAELRVLTSIAERLRAAAAAYGCLALRTDRRSLRHVSREEVEDFLVQTACEHLLRAELGGAR